MTTTVQTTTWVTAEGPNGVGKTYLLARSFAHE
jgi:ABC-type transport system involved in cytochrome c biogenesis ATPase subunit